MKELMMSFANGTIMAVAVTGVRPGACVTPAAALQTRPDVTAQQRTPVYQHGSNVPLMTREIEQGTADHHGDELYETRG